MSPDGWQSVPVPGGAGADPGADLPVPDDQATAAALARLSELDVPGAGFGALARAVGFLAGCQGTSAPHPWRSPRVLMVHGDHAGGAAAGTAPGECDRRAALARAGTGPLGLLARRAGAAVHVVHAQPSRPMELAPALPDEQADEALRYGWWLAGEAVDAGTDVVIIAACGLGTDAAATAVVAAAEGIDVAAALPRAVTAGGRIDDDAWMRRCAAVRDALRRIRYHRNRSAIVADHSFSRMFKANLRRATLSPRELLAQLGGGDVAVATGILLGAAARRTPVLVDGPVGVAAVTVGRKLARNADRWCLLPDHGGNCLVRVAAKALGLIPFTDLRLDLGEGAAALAALVQLDTAVALAAALPTLAVAGSAL